jgi:hypothetical protein
MRIGGLALITALCISGCSRTADHQSPQAAHVDNRAEKLEQVAEATSVDNEPERLEQVAEATRVDNAAEKLEQVADTLKSEVRHFAPASGSDFPQLDLAWYSRSAQTLGTLGYRPLGELVDVEHNGTHPTAKTFVRVLVSPDGETTAGLWHYWDSNPALQRTLLNNLRVLDLETELSDGTFVITSNMPHQADFDMGPAIERQIIETNDLRALVDAHSSHLRIHCSKYPGTRALRQSTLADAIGAQERQHQAKAKYRREMEIPFTEDELNNVTDNKMQRPVRAVSDELRRRFPAN